MTTLGDILILLDNSLGTTESRFFTESKRIQAINTAMKKILMMYDVNEYIHEDSLAFVNGVCAQPTGCMRLNLLVDSSGNEYELVDFETFKYKQGLTYTVKYDTVTSAKYLYIYPANSVSLYLTYIEQYTNMTASGDTIRLGDWWAEGIAEKAAAILLRNARMYDVAQDKETSAKKMLDDAYQNDRPGLQGRTLTRLQSIYERKNMFTNWAYISTPNTINVNSLTWQTITTNITATPNHGYFVDSASITYVTLPLSTNINVGDMIAVTQQSHTWHIAQNASQYIVFGTSQTTTGTGGYLESTGSGDSVVMVYRGNGVFEVIASQGNITIV